MHELQVPTRRLEVEIVTTAGREMRGSLFAPESRFPTGEAEFLDTLLNDERTFLPFKPDGGRDVLFNKVHLSRVRLLGVDDLEGPESSDGDGRCRLVLADGSSVEAHVVVETRQASSRILDKLNQANVFLPLVTERGIEFVRREHVVQVE